MKVHFFIHRYTQGLRLLVPILVALVGLVLVSVTMAQSQLSLSADQPTSVAAFANQSEAETVKVVGRGGIAGTVTALDGRPLSDIEVQAYRRLAKGWEQVRSTTTDASGNYLLRTLERGIYRLRFQHSSGSFEYYGHVRTLNEATNIPVLGDIVTDINTIFSPRGHVNRTGQHAAETVARPSATGGISGIITASGGTPLSDIEVTAYQQQPWGWDQIQSTSTDASGNYLIASLDTAIYRLRFRDYNGTHAFEYYDDALTLDDATDIPVTGDIVTGINAVLSPGGHISGTVTMYDGQPPDAVMSGVDIYHHNGVEWTTVSYAYLDEGTGSYDVGGLPSGVYRVYVYGEYQAVWYEKYYDNATDIESATDVLVTAGSTIPDIDVVLGDNTNYGQITGTVTSLAGLPLSEIEVTAYISRTWGWDWVRSTTTDMSGNYQLPALEPADYAIRFQDQAGTYAFEYYDDALTLNDATPISLTGGSVIPNINAVLSEGGRISGAIKMYDGQPPEAVMSGVQIYHHDGFEWTTVSYAYLDEGTGSYDVGGLPSGVYRVYVYGEYQAVWYEEYYDNATDIESATDVLVTAGSSTPNIDMVLGDNTLGRISGTVTANGVPQEGILIDLYQDYNDYGEWWRLVFAYTDADGNYSIGGLRDGDYRVRFSDPNGVHATIFYDGKADLASADTIPITDSATVGNIDAALTGAGAISGTVTLSDTNGSASGISVVAYRYNGTTWEGLGTTTTAANGEYVVSGLLHGDYRLYFLDPTLTYRAEYYLDVRSITDATNVTVVTNTVTSNINAVLDLPAPPTAEVDTDGGSVTTDPDTGKVTIMFPAGEPADTTINKQVSCSDGSTPTNVTLILEDAPGNPLSSYAMLETPSGSGTYQATIPADDITNATMTVSWDCNAIPEEEEIGDMVLYDPSGYITDATTGDPIEGAAVTLYRVPNWLPDTETETRNCRTVLTRNGGDWGNEPDATIDLGVVVNPTINRTAEISPTINPQITNDDGYYGWDVVQGCWYVVVQAEGYEPRVSPLVGVPPEVTDLDLELTPSQTPTPSITDIRTTNVRDVSFTVSWLTDVESTGEVRYGTDPNNLNQTAVDERGAATSDDTHVVTLAGLDANTTYYFLVVSGSTTDDNGGAHYSVTTGPTLGLPSSDTIFGEVKGEDGSTPAEGTIVYITLQDGDGAGSSGQAAPLSAWVNSNGEWSVNLGNARTADLSSYFLYSASGDTVSLQAEGAADGVGCLRVDTADDTPGAAITLSPSECTITITWPIGIQTGWNHISLPIAPLTPYRASDVCNEINSQGGNAVEIDRWHNGGWEGHICGQTFNNFDLVLGSDYFIKSGANSTWTIEGYQVTTAVPLTLQSGWNSIAIPHTEAYSASSLCDEIINQGVTALEIDRWHHAGWEGHICGLPFNDFDIERGVGYFVKSSSAGSVTPSAPASRQSKRPTEDRAPLEVPSGPFQPIRDLRVSNLRDTSVTLSWTTDEPTTGYVLFGRGNPTKPSQVALDLRGASHQTTHYVTLTDLEPETSYDLKVVSGAQRSLSLSKGDDTVVSITTAPTLESVPASDTVYGQVFFADGVTPATDLLLYLTLQDADGPSTSSGTGDAAEATLLSALVDENGYWHANLGNARMADGRLFDYSPSGDELLIEVQGAESLTQTVGTANLAPAPDIVLTDANVPTSITVAAFDNTSPSASLLGIPLGALAMLAGTLLVWRRRRL